MAKSKKKRKVISVKKRLLFVSGFFVFFILLGIGFSILSSNLSIAGDINVYAPLEPTLYNVFKKQARIGNVALEYTGVHQDSMNSSLSTEKVYHWSTTDASAVSNINNVIFAGFCWQTIRTTDTGGVRMIYNGYAEDGKCLDTKANNQLVYGYGSTTSTSMYNNYYYGTDFTYDSSTGKFSLTGNVTTGEIIIGSFTCRNNNIDGSCSTLYYIDKYNSGDNYIVYSIGYSSPARVIGFSKFNLINNKSLAAVGYMYGDIYDENVGVFTNSQQYSVFNVLASTVNLKSNYYYSEDISFDGSTYTLVNPVTGSNIEGGDYSGYYTFNSYSSSGTNPYYVLGLSSGTNYYCARLSSTQQLNDLNVLVGDSIVNNGNDTYSLNNPVSVNIVDWYTDYNNYVSMYTCGDGVTSTCSNPRYMYKTYYNYYYYIDASIKLLLAKERNNLQLNDTIVLNIDELIKNKNSYSEYKYTCGNLSNICTEDNFRVISSISESSYTYYPNYYFGSSVTWDGTQYTLVDVVDNEHRTIGSRHYSCFIPGAKVCSKVAYFHGNYYPSPSYPNYYYIWLENVQDVDTAIDDMLSNENNSYIKGLIELWYKINLLDYDHYIDDTIYCHDRSLSSNYGWKNLSGMSFGVSDGLTCSRVNDRFSVSNPAAPLTYKVGMATSREMSLVASDIRAIEYTYWLFSPRGTYNTPQMGSSSTIHFVDTYGRISGGGEHPTSDSEGIRPVISLKPGIEYVSGDGSKDNPFVVDTN